MNSLPALLALQASERSDLRAIIETSGGRTRTITFFELNEQSNRFASQLIQHGVQKGDSILVLVPMSIRLYVVLMGLFRIGAVATFPDLSAGVERLNACCKINPPKGIVGGLKARLFTLFSTEARKIPLFFGLHNKPHHQVPLPDYPDQNDPALLTFTSGSTGLPKAALRTHRFLIAQYEALKDSIELCKGEVDLTTLPIFVLANLASGVTSLLPDADLAKPGLVNVTRIAKQLSMVPSTRTGGSPAFFERLADYSESKKNILAPFLKIYTGGAPVFPSLLKRIQILAPQAKIVAVYGSTEAEPMAHIGCHEIAEEDWEAMASGKGLLAGKPVPQIQLRIIRDSWGNPFSPMTQVELDQLHLAHGAIGEIVVTGAHVLKRYYLGQGESETKFRVDDEIWHRTGDAGWIDSQERLWLMGRCSAKIQDEKGLLYPFAVECVARSFTYVFQAAFVAFKGKRILVLEHRKPPLQGERDGLINSLKWALLDQTVVLKKIPLDQRHNSKVDYTALHRALTKIIV